MSGAVRPQGPPRPALDLSLYLVTDTGRCRRHGIVATVRQAVAAGATVVQVRDPDASDDEFVALGHLVRSGLRGSAVPLIVNDRVHLVEEIGAQGAHIGQGDLHPVEARRRLGPAAYLGLSVGSAQELARAHWLEPGVLDYLGVGPVWPTGSKRDAGPPIGPEGVADLVRASRLPCVAVGGITLDRVAAVRASGADGVAVVSAICGAADVAAAAAGLRAAWQGSS